MGHMHPVSIVNSASDREFFVCTWHMRVCGWFRYDEYHGVSSPPAACIPNNMHPMYNVPQLATTVSHSQPLPTKYFANGGSIAVISMSQVIYNYPEQKKYDCEQQTYRSTGNELIFCCGSLRCIVLCYSWVVSFLIRVLCPHKIGLCKDHGISPTIR